jgi:hypothetical protein
MRLAPQGPGLALLALLLVAACDEDPIPDQPDASTRPRTGCVEGDFTAFRGNLHAHTSSSDGTGTPADAFAMAREAGLDIQVISDHLEQLYDASGLPTSEYPDCLAQADLATVPGQFVATCGFEYGTGVTADASVSTGHANVFFSPDLLPKTQLELRDFYASLATCNRCIGQFNHPGRTVGQDWEHFAYDDAVAPRMALLEMNSGPAWLLLFWALDAGWHVGPTNNQDNHAANWGTANERRSGFWMTALDREGLAEAMLARRTFASDDANASLRLMAEGTCWMGSHLAGYPTVTFFAEAIDPDDLEPFTSLELFGPGQELLHTADCQGLATCTVTWRITVTASTYVLARARQPDGHVLVSAPIWVAP